MSYRVDVSSSEVLEVPLHADVGVAGRVEAVVRHVVERVVAQNVPGVHQPKQTRRRNTIGKLVLVRPTIAMILGLPDVSRICNR